jgi:hypothetical protein
MKEIQKWTLTMLDDALATASHNPPASPPPDFPVLIAQLTDVIAKAMMVKRPTEDRRPARSVQRVWHCSTNT